MELIIEKLGYGGEGLARMEAADGRRKTVFIPLVLPDERVEATIVEERPGFARAKLDRVIESSAHRTAAPCPYFGECGGCHYQHTAYDTQLQLKQQILRETVARIAKIDLPEIVVHASPPLHYRNRTRLKLRATADGGTKFVIGYHKLSSHALLPVRECPISSPLINRALQTLWSIAGEQPLPHGLAEIEFFASHDDQHLLAEFLVDRLADQPTVTKLATALSRSLPEMIGVATVPRLTRKDELVAAPELDGGAEEKATVITGQGQLTYEIGEHSYVVSAGSFFQTNRHLAAKLLDLACAGAQGRLAIDLYAGVGLFTLPLARTFERVIAVEAAPSSFADLRVNGPRHAKVVQSTAEAFLARASQKPDFVVVDPPRSGLGKKVIDGLVKLAPRNLTYVSCDPSTMARDLPGLVASGYRITQAHLVDLFPQTFHIETVLRMER
jgi:23S rRNA (uracil1939-C5)-methyltransferase